MMDQFVARSCAGKFQHQSKRDADKEVKRKKFLTSYRCKVCAFWHVGHPKKKRKVCYS